MITESVRWEVSFFFLSFLFIYEVLDISLWTKNAETDYNVCIVR